MTQSVREQIVQAMIDTIETAVPSITIVRWPQDPIAHDKAQVCVVDWREGNTSEIGYERFQSVMSVLVSLLTKSSTAEQQSDEQLVTIQNALMADRTVGGLALDVRPARFSKQRDETDVQHCVVTHEYQVEFRYSNLNQASA